MTLSSRPPFPTAVDSSFLNDLRSCVHKAYLSQMLHWKPKSTNIHLNAGGAFAKGLEVARKAYYDLSIDPQSATIEGGKALIAQYEEPSIEDADHAKSLPNMLGALGSYFQVHPLDTDSLKPHRLPSGKPAIEFTFAIPLSICNPETGEPILYTGRCDMIGEYNGQLFVVDEKTTSGIGPTWFNNWALKSQLTGYVWAARQYGFDVAGAIIRGIAILKREFKHAESIQYRPQWMIDRWYKQTERDLARLIECWKEDYYDYNLDSACSSYGGCQFLKICSSNNPEPWLEADFEKRVWDPLQHVEYVPLKEI